MPQLKVYLSSPVAKTCLIISLQKDAAFLKAFETRYPIISVRPPYERDLIRWRGYFEKKYKKNIASDAWQTLISLKKNLSLLNQEIAKLSTCIEPNTKIEREDIVNTLSLEEKNTIEFVELVVERRYRHFFSLYFLLDKKDEIGVLGLLVYKFKQFQTVIGARGNNESLAKELGLSPFVLSKIQSQTRHFSFQKVDRILTYLHELDVLLKVASYS